MQKDWRFAERGIFMVNLLAIVYNDTKILIGKRFEDEYINELNWSFPGGRPIYNETLENSLKYEVKRKTNIDIEIKCLYHARLFESKPHFMLLYYIAKSKNNNIIAGEKFFDVKWIESDIAESYFNTPTDQKISFLLKNFKKCLSNGKINLELLLNSLNT